MSPHTEVCKDVPCQLCHPVVSFSGNFPLYMVAAHRLTRLGLASTYSTTKRLVQLKLTTESGSTFAHKWPPLKDAVTLTIIYRDRRVTL